MKRTASVVVGWVLAVFGWLWTGAKLLLDGLGRLDVLKGFNPNDNSVSWIVQVISNTPWWVPTICAFVFTAVVAALLLRHGSPPALAPLDVAQSDVLGSRVSSPSAPVVTRLRLQFNHGTILPRSVDQRNVSNWYAHYSDFAISTPPDSSAGRPSADQVFSARLWVVFLLFETPTSFSQMVIDGGGAQLPHHEVKQSSDRHAIVSFLGDLAGVTIEIRGVSPD